MTTAYSIHSLDGGRVLVAVGLTLTSRLRSMLIEAGAGQARSMSVPVDGVEPIPGIRIDGLRTPGERPFFLRGVILERDDIAIRSLLAAHAEEPIS